MPLGSSGERRIVAQDGKDNGGIGRGKGSHGVGKNIPKKFKYEGWAVGTGRWIGNNLWGICGFKGNEDIYLTLLMRLIVSGTINLDYKSKF